MWFKNQNNHVHDFEKWFAPRVPGILVPGTAPELLLYILPATILKMRAILSALCSAQSLYG